MLDSNLSIVLASGYIEIDGNILFQFRVYKDNLRLYINTTGLTVYGYIHVMYNEYYGSIYLFYKMIGEIWIELYII